MFGMAGWMSWREVEGDAQYFAGDMGTWEWDEGWMGWCLLLTSSTGVTVV